VDRVKWFRERANRDRWREETEILEAEFERTFMSHSRMSAVWHELATRCADQHGAVAYAIRKAHMYESLAAECSKIHKLAKETAEKADHGFKRT
jgi:hypothetical protein